MCSYDGLGFSSTCWKTCCRMRATWIQTSRRETTVYSDGGRLMRMPVMRSLRASESEGDVRSGSREGEGKRRRETHSSCAFEGSGVVTCVGWTAVVLRYGICETRGEAVSPALGPSQRAFGEEETHREPVLARQGPEDPLARLVRDEALGASLERLALDRGEPRLLGRQAVQAEVLREADAAASGRRASASRAHVPPR